MALSAGNLFDLSDEPVWRKAREIFTWGVKGSPSVRELFFPSEPTLAAAPADTTIGAPAAAALRSAPFASWLDDLAVALVCSSISRSALYGFAGCVDQARADAHWKGELRGETCLAANRALYGILFLDHCTAGGHSLRNYLVDDQPWGDTLARHLIKPSFVNVDLARVINSGAGWIDRLRLALDKVTLLGARPQERAARQQGRALNHTHVLDGWSAAVYPLLGGTGPSPRYDDPVSTQLRAFAPRIDAAFFRDDHFIGEVNAAIAVEDYSSRTLTSSWVEEWVYGDKVQAFITGRAARLRLSTGAAPANRKSVRHGNSRGR
jgi:hypothetical protein